MKNPDHSASSRTSMEKNFTRRRFLATTGAALTLPVILPSRVLGLDGSVIPSNKINLGIIGCGNMGTGNTKQFLQEDACRVVAACDVDKTRLTTLVGTINEGNGNRDCKPYHDFRELLARTDIDAVMIALPDHWHGMASTEAARRGKDIYGEKPLAHTIAEQQAIVRAVQKHKRIWQTGSWQRSVRNFR